LEAQYPKILAATMVFEFYGLPNWFTADLISKNIGG
jgi:hypothetical protein